MVRGKPSKKGYRDTRGMDAKPSFPRTGGKSDGFPILGKITKRIRGLKRKGR